VARDHASGHGSAGTVGESADAGQYARQLLVTARLQRDLRQSRHRERDPHRGDVPRRRLPGELRWKCRADQERKLARAASSDTRRRVVKRTPVLVAVQGSPAAGDPSGFGLDGDGAPGIRLPSAGGSNASELEVTMVVDSAAAIRFLRTAFELDDWIAVFLKSYETGRAVQRVGPVSIFLEPRVHAWLRAMNARRYNCYVATNSIRPGVRARTKDSIGTVRHVFLETDGDGQRLLDAIAGRLDLPAPSYTIESSPNRFHVLWRVAGFTTEYVERLQKHLARELGTDTAATPCSQTTRIPGYRNQKRLPTHLVTVQYRSIEDRYMPAAFPAPPEPPAPPARRAMTPLATALDALERARRYVARVEPAIAGQHGDLHTFRVCCRIVRGFALDDDEALAALSEWNQRCAPPWSERELRDKIARARRYGREAMGGLLTSGKPDGQTCGKARSLLSR
jgi:hypothetical protein